MKIKEIRDKTGLTQTEFGDLLGIPMRSIQNWEKGWRTPPQYIVDLIEFKVKSIYKNTKRRDQDEDDNKKGGV